jgi:hypothetical protein
MRGGLGFEGIGAKYATVQAAGSVSSVALVSGAAYVEGKAVTVEGNATYGFGSDGDPLKGIIDKYETDGNMTVQFAGFKEDVPCISGSLPTAGKFICVNGSGSVSQVASTNVGPAYAVSVDSTADVNTATIFIG